MEGKCLKVNVSVPNTRLFIGNIPKSKTHSDIYQEFCKIASKFQRSHTDDKRNPPPFFFFIVQTYFFYPVNIFCGLILFVSARKKTVDSVVWQCSPIQMQIFLKMWKFSHRLQESCMLEGGGGGSDVNFCNFGLSPEGR